MMSSPCREELKREKTEMPHVGRKKENLKEMGLMILGLKALARFRSNRFWQGRGPTYSLGSYFISS
jgi:hypothetical protein